MRTRVTSHENEPDSIIENTDGNTERYRNLDILHVHKLAGYLSTSLKAENSSTGVPIIFPTFVLQITLPHPTARRS